jgi:hypothetical protein
MARKNDHLELVNNKKRKPGWKKLLNMFIKLVVLVGLIILLKYGEAFFRVSDITVEGAKDLTAQAVINSSGLEEGMSMILLNEKKIAERIMHDYPEIKEVKLERNLPDSLVLAVTERTLAAYLMSADGYWMIDRDAVCFAFTGKITGGFPVITGISDTLLIPGEPLECPFRRETLSNLFANWPGPELLDIETMDFSDRYNLVINTADGWQIWLGDGKNMDTKLLLVSESIPYIDRDALVRLDVRSGKRLVASGSTMISDKEVEP